MYTIEGAGARENYRTSQSARAFPNSTEIVLVTRKGPGARRSLLDFGGSDEDGSRMKLRN